MRLLRILLLPAAIILGLFSPWAVAWAWLVKWLLAGMVFFAFVGSIRFSWGSTWILLSRLTPVWFFLAPLCWLLMREIFPQWPGVSWAVFMVCMAPTATAAPVVVRMAGGDPTHVVAGVVLQHLLAGLAIPLWVGVLGGVGLSGYAVPKQILIGSIPMIVFPLWLAFLCRKFIPRLADHLERIQPLNLFLWAIAVFLVVGRARHDFAELGLLDIPGAPAQIGVIALASLLLCIGLFYLGYVVGNGSGQGDEGSQILGQKNTILAIWIAGTWLGSWAMLGPLFYILWQNLYIAWRAAQGSKPTVRSGNH